MMMSALPYLTINNAAYLATAATAVVTTATSDLGKGLIVGGVVTTAGLVAAVAATGFAASFSAVNIGAGIVACCFTAYMLANTGTEESFMEKVGVGFKTIGLAACSYTLLNAIFSLGKYIVAELSRLELTGFGIGNGKIIPIFTIPK